MLDGLEDESFEIVDDEYCVEVSDTLRDELLIRTETEEDKGYSCYT